MSYLKMSSVRELTLAAVSPALRAERFRAAEALRNAELEAERAQQTLAELVQWSPGAPPPLPSCPKVLVPHAHTVPSAARATL